jgi:hypothetical protein
MHTPEPLRLKQTRRHSRLPAECGGAGFRQATFAEVKDFFENPKASRANALNPFLVMQANLYVTQVSCHCKTTLFTVKSIDQATRSICGGTISR